MADSVGLFGGVAPHPEAVATAQQETEAAVARKTQEHQATADAWASRVVRPAFATLAQHFNQGSDKRSLVVRPDLPRGEAVA